MKAVLLFSLLFFSLFAEEANFIQTDQLTPFEKSVLQDKATERAFSGKYYKFDKKGSYFCNQCGIELFTSSDKFASHCGWPSFDDAIEGRVKELPDADGRRVEIVCANCGGHLGHIFRGESYTSKNQRFCVNSASIEFSAKDFFTKKLEKKSSDPIKKAYFAGGCFWGVEYYLEKAEGVLSVESGYMGGRTKNPSYHDVSYKNTGHIESVEVVYDSRKTSYEKLARLFFEIHDPTQKKRQGPDIGEQYSSVIFYSTQAEKKIDEKLIALLKKNGYNVQTELRPAVEFYKAETYHQNYYDKKGKKPYCHGYVKRF